MSEKKMERKTFPAFVIKVDEEQGIIEAVFAVFGNVDEGDDVVHPGAFAKTFTERGTKVKVLDNHLTDSIMRVIGKPLMLAEIGKDQLPPQVLAKSPDAMGGAFAKIQMLMNTPEGKGAFERLKSGAVDEWSFGYDAVDYDHGKAERDGEERTVRNLRQIKLYEVSPVLWGMNPATTTASAKAQPTEAKPWNVFPVGAEFCVFRVDDEGNRMGESLGCHDTRAAAREQVEALYANEPKDDEKAPMRSEQDGKHPASHYLVVEDPQKPSTWHLRVRDANGSVSHRLMGAAWAALHGGYRGNRYQGLGKQEAIRKLRSLYEREGMDVPGKADSIVSELANAIVEQVEKERLRFAEILYHIKTFDYEKAYAEYAENIGKAELDETDKKQAILNAVLNERAGPLQDEPPTSEEAGPEKATPTNDELLRLIEIEKQLMKFDMEV
jgi:phage head maturation protease